MVLANIWRVALVWGRRVVLLWDGRLVGVEGLERVNVLVALVGNG